MAKTPRLSPSVSKLVGCKGAECLAKFTFIKVPKGKVSKNGISWEYSARCPNCPKVVTFSEAMMKNIHKCVRDISISKTINTFDSMFTKT